MKFRKPTFPLFFRKLSKKSGSGGSPVVGVAGGDEATIDDAGVSGRWSFDFKNSPSSSASSSGLRWKRKFTVYTWFIDGFVFKIVYVLEAVVLVFTLCFFYLCCGCHL